MPIVELLTTDTHRGAVHRPGDRLTVDDFITRGAAKLAFDPHQTPSSPDPEPPMSSPQRTCRAGAELTSTPNTPEHEQ